MNIFFSTIAFFPPFTLNESIQEKFKQLKDMGLTSVSPGNTGCSSDCPLAAERPSSRPAAVGLAKVHQHLAHAPQRPSAVCPFPWLRSPSAWKTKKMKLKSLLLRYYPPGIMLEYEKGGKLKTKSIDLLELNPSTDVNNLVEEIQKVEPLITVSRTQQIRLLVQRLQEKLRQHCDHNFYLFKVRSA